MNFWYWHDQAQKWKVFSYRMDGALSCIIANSTAFSTSTRRHIELALCHLAQNGTELTWLLLHI